MSERFERLFALPENNYTAGSPVIISAGVLLKDKETNKIIAQLKFKNISPKIIKAVKVVVYPQDITRKPLGREIVKEYLDLSVYQGVEFGQRVAIILPDASTRAFSADVTQVVFEDRSVWQAEDASWEELPAPVSLSDSLGDAELAKQFQIKYGEDCAVAPKEYKDLWLCACGAWNAGKTCYSCRKAKDLLLSYDSGQLTVDRDTRLKKEKKEREAKEAAEREAARKKAEEEKQRKSRVQSIAKKTAKAILAVTLTAFLVYVIGWHLIPFIRYKTACKALDTQDYDKAYETFAALGDFNDSADKAIETLYQKGIYLMKIEAFRDAAVEFGKVPEYLDSSELSVQCRNEADYLDAKGCLGNGDFRQAMDSFIALNDYKDSEKLADESAYLLAMQLFDKASYGEAYTYFKELSSYKDSKDRANEAEYQYAIQCFNAEEYEEAIKAFKTVKGYNDSAERLLEAKYQYGLAQSEKSDWETASIMFKELGTYQDSEARYQETGYKYGMELLKGEEFYKAVQVFKTLKGFQDSDAKLNEAEYGYVKKHINKNDRLTYTYLDELKAIQYKDARELYESLYQWEVQQIAVNTSRNDYETILPSVSRFCDYCHFEFKVCGGPFNETITLSHRITWPNGSVSYSDWYWEKAWVGSILGFYWDGFDNPSNMAKGTMTVTVYNVSTGKTLCETSIRLT